MRKLLTVILIGFMLVACDSKQVYDKYKTIPKYWGKEHRLNFNFKAPDTVKNYNLFLNIRNNNNYKFSNLFLIVDFITPNNNKTIDTLEYRMANPDGSWLGTGFSDLKENKLWFRERYRFKKQGEYKINVKHAMRKNGSILGIEELQGITEVGFRIEKEQ